MRKRLILTLALALVVGFAFCAYAEVQNVKVSGDLTIKGVSRNDLDLRQTEMIGVSTETSNDEEDNFLSIVRLRVDADLTDNVSTSVRLISERDWDGEDGTAADNDIDLDLAYATMKEFLYSPLTLTVGRQELRYGNGLIVGDPDTNNVSGTSSLQQSDLSLRKAFDAIKAVLDYDPLVVDLIYAKIDENTVRGSGANDDVDLYGINANYALDKETTLEGYIFRKRKGSNYTGFTSTERTDGNTLTVANNNKKDTVDTVGMRVANTSVKNLTAQIEGAYQFGTYNPDFDINSAQRAVTGHRKAWALQAIADYNLADIFPYKPSIRGVYTYLSGEEDGRTVGDYRGWDAMFEDQTVGHIINRMMGFSNCQLGALTTKLIPMEDLSLNIDYAYFWLNKRFPKLTGTTAGINTTNLRGISGADTYIMTGSRKLGQEIDATLTYDYTEDVQFSLMGGVFIPDEAFSTLNDEKASEVIGSMKVTF